MGLARTSVATADIDGLLAAVRPELHRYCAGILGSVIDGEDMLQHASSMELNI
jgi:RNA polymerase sigma-70 factor, ECF subfamily